MRARTVILILAAAVLFNALVVAGVWLWVNIKAANLARSSNRMSGTNPVNDPGASPSSEDSAATLDTSSLPVPDISAMSVEIDLPRDGDAVPRRFHASGRCGPVPPGNQLMLVVDSGRGVYSPKMPPLTVNGESWEGAGNEFGAPVGGSFSLCVFLVSDQGVQRISEWHAQNKAIGKYPPFRGAVPGGVSLARIQLRVARN
jgi:hypothetical protein